MNEIVDKKSFRTQFSERIPVVTVIYPPSEVQSGQSPSISKIVKTRRVGGNELDEYEMDGILEGSELGSEYLDFFDMQDIAQAEAERQASQSAPPDGGQPPTSEPSEGDSGNEPGSENE